MAPHEDMALEPEFVLEFFSCTICANLLHEPVTVPCCGATFCRRCLRQWIQSSVHTAGVPTCPAGCLSKLPFRLPARSQMLQGAILHLLKAEAETRAEEDREDVENEDKLLGGLSCWQEVVCSRDVYFGSNEVGVRAGTPGIVVSNYMDGRHVTVKFDYREDGSELCVNVLPEALMDPLPGGFRPGQRVQATINLTMEGALGVRLGTGGVIVGRVEQCLVVDFDQRADGVDGTVCVEGTNVIEERLLVGGYKLAQLVQAATDLHVGNKLSVPAGAYGYVIGEYSSTRLTVNFGSEPSDSTTPCLNVLPMEILPCPLPLAKPFASAPANKGGDGGEGGEGCGGAASNTDPSEEEKEAEELEEREEQDEERDWEEHPSLAAAEELEGAGDDDGDENATVSTGRDAEAPAEATRAAVRERRPGTAP